MINILLHANSHFWSWGVPIILKTIGIIFACVVGVYEMVAINKVRKDFNIGE